MELALGKTPNARPRPVSPIIPCGVGATSQSLCHIGKDLRSSVVFVKSLKTVEPIWKNTPNGIYKRHYWVDEKNMRHTIELLHKVFDSRKGLCEHFGISTMTVSRWKKIGVLPEPIRIGRAAYYDRAAIEAKLFENASAVTPGTTVFTSEVDEIAVAAESAGAD